MTAEIIPINQRDKLLLANKLLNEALNILGRQDPEAFWKVADARDLLLEHIRSQEQLNRR